MATQRNFALYHTAVAADAAYQKELVRVYGTDDAGNARYLLQKDDDVPLLAAREAKLQADAKWIAEMQR